MRPARVEGERRPLAALVASVLAGVILSATLAVPAHALRVVTWNLLQYPATNLAARQPHFRTVMANLQADVLIAQELNSVAGADSFRLNVLDVVQPGQWSSTWLAVGAGEGMGIFWRAPVATVFNASTIGTGGPRSVLVCGVRPAGYGAPTFFRLYSVHFKAGNPAFSPSDSTTRRLECSSLRNTLNTVPANTNLLLGGDTNFYGDWEGGYIRLVEAQLDNDGRLVDSHPLPGTWNQSAYRFHHSQCPCASGCGAGFSGGGLDDRFDLFLSSTAMNDGEGFDVLPASNFPYGNDGNHYNLDINNPANTAVPAAVANALHDASDHIPVIMDVQIPARIQAASQLDFGAAIVGAAPIARTLSVADVATLPADELNYSFTAPSGFTAPAGSFIANAGAPANDHALSMSASVVGVKTGTLTVACDDPDSSAKAVLLSGRVLRHAVASLDSQATVTETTLDFGERVAGDFADRPVRVHDRGYDALQAQLAISGAAIVGGDGRFSIVGGFSPATIGAIGRTWSIRFDDTGATTDSLYEATLTFTTADQALPGAAPAANLVVHLRAYRISAPVAVGEPPASLRFEAPRPNPTAGGTRFAFELPARVAVTLEVFDLGGRRVASLVEGTLEAGRHERTWNARDERGMRQAGGLYFVRFATPGLVRTERLILLP